MQAQSRPPMGEYRKKPVRILRMDRRWKRLRRQPHPEDRRVRSIIRNSQDTGYTSHQIVDRLNRAGLSTVRGRVWNVSNLGHFMTQWGLSDDSGRREFRKAKLRSAAIAGVLRRVRPGRGEPFTAATLLPHLRVEEWHRHAFDIPKGGDIGLDIVARVEEVLLRYVKDGRLVVVRHGVYEVNYAEKGR